MFFLSTFAPGNGGALRRPSKDYQETNEKIRNGVMFINDNDNTNNENDDNYDENDSN